MFILKKIREETPADPFEAELLLMAGMVANDLKHENVSSSDSENDVSNNGNKIIFLWKFYFLVQIIFI